ncbi:hypothetical protein MNBD_DELTA03-1058 [hydrothermal vent metagenome]|uniref:Cupin type-2 domain-containing protein n=1 Tax=hydrothermal vent metagenome TaxID=652676 RepID=A0A3B0VFC8_9ZZZZ
MKAKNIFSKIPADLKTEFIETICSSQKIRIERIVSRGHKSAPDFWYDQKDNEWVIVLKGEAEIEFESGGKLHLATGAYLNIPAHKRHRVSWTGEGKTVWLTVRY